MKLCESLLVTHTFQLDPSEFCIVVHFGAIITFRPIIIRATCNGIDHLNQPGPDFEPLLPGSTPSSPALDLKPTEPLPTLMPINIDNLGNMKNR